MRLWNPCGWVAWNATQAAGKGPQQPWARGPLKQLMVQQMLARGAQQMAVQMGLPRQALQQQGLLQEQRAARQRGPASAQQQWYWSSRAQQRRACPTTSARSCCQQVRPSCMGGWHCSWLNGWPHQAVMGRASELDPAGGRYACIWDIMHGSPHTPALFVLLSTQPVMMSERSPDCWVWLLLLCQGYMRSQPVLHQTCRELEQHQPRQQQQRAPQTRAALGPLVYPRPCRSSSHQPCRHHLQHTHQRHPWQLPNCWQQVPPWPVSAQALLRP